MPESKVVADTNVLVSGLLWIGSPHKIIKLAESRKMQLYSSPRLLDELFDVLGRDKFRKRIGELNTSREELVESLLGVIEIIHPTVTLSAVIADPDDNAVLECAGCAGADYVVTGDPHLLRLKMFMDIPIYNPQKMLSIVSS